MGHIKSLLILSAALLVSLSCAEKQIVKRYFILNTDETLADSVSFAPSLPFSIQVGSMKTSPAYKQTHIALRSNSNELRYYYYNLWAGRPSQAIRFFIFSRLMQNHLFERNISEIGAATPDFILTGFIQQLERISLSAADSAHLKMQLQLIDVKTNRVVVSFLIDRKLPLKKNSPMNAFAKAVSQILSEETDSFFSKIYKTLKNQYHGK